jgi:uncharacterized tellurite resistance protein B-like protein
MSAHSLVDLTREESLALIGLLKIMIEADKRFGLRESATLQLLAERMGRKLFNQLVDEARPRFPDRDTLKVQAAAIERPAARALIFATLKEMAYADDQLNPAESDLLVWLAQVWRLDPPR